MAKIYNLKNIKKNDYIEISEILEKGGLIIYPTETIYGIGCNALNKIALKKLYKVKKRPLEKKTILLFKDIFSVKKHMEIISHKEKELMEKYWPGEVTIILKEKASHNSIACRVSPHPFLKKLFKYIDFPLTSTSANLSGREYSGDIYEIIHYFQDKVDAIIDAGNLSNKLPSTIVRVVNNRVVILRQGKVIINQ